MIGVVLVATAASLLAAYVLAGSAPATTRQSAPIWLSTADTTLSGRTLTVYGGIDVNTDLSGAVVKLYKREVGRNVDTFVGKATVTYSMTTGNVFQGKILASGAAASSPPSGQATPATSPRAPGCSPACRHG